MKHTRIQKHFDNIVVEDFLLIYNCRNVMQLPKMEKGVLSISSKDFLLDKQELINNFATCLLISGQKSAPTRARKSISAFQLRKGGMIGCMVTMRKDKMYALLDRIVSFVLPCLQSQSTKHKTNTFAFNQVCLQSPNDRLCGKEQRDLCFGIEEPTLFPEIESLSGAGALVQKNKTLLASPKQSEALLVTRAKLRFASVRAKAALLMSQSRKDISHPEKVLLQAKFSDVLSESSVQSLESEAQAKVKSRFHQSKAAQDHFSALPELGSTKVGTACSANRVGTTEFSPKQSEALLVKPPVTQAKLASDTSKATLCYGDASASRINAPHDTKLHKTFGVPAYKQTFGALQGLNVLFSFCLCKQSEALLAHHVQEQSKALLKLASHPKKGRNTFHHISQIQDLPTQLDLGTSKMLSFAQQKRASSVKKEGQKDLLFLSAFQYPVSSSS